MNKKFEHFNMRGQFWICFEEKRKYAYLKMRSISEPVLHVLKIRKDENALNTIKNLIEKNDIKALQELYFDLFNTYSQRILEQRKTDSIVYYQKALR